MTDDDLIYIADDEADLVDLLKEALETDGYEVEVANDGEGLLDLVDERIPDLVLLDIAMPGLSGWEVQKELRSREETRSIPVIAITAQGGASVETSARNALGFHDFLRKPFQMQELLDRTRDALDTRGGD